MYDYTYYVLLYTPDTLYLLYIYITKERIYVSIRALFLFLIPTKNAFFYLLLHTITFIITVHVPWISDQYVLLFIYLAVN